MLCSWVVTMSQPPSYQVRNSPLQVQNPIQSLHHGLDCTSHSICFAQPHGFDSQDLRWIIQKKGQKHRSTTVSWNTRWLIVFPTMGIYGSYLSKIILSSLIYSSTYVYVYIYICICICIFVYLHLYVNVYVHIYIYIYTYIHINVNIYVYIFT